MMDFPEIKQEEFGITKEFKLVLKSCMVILLISTPLRFIEVWVKEDYILLSSSSPFLRLTYAFMFYLIIKTNCQRAVLMQVFFEALNLHGFYLAFFTHPEQKYLVGFLVTIIF